MIQIARDIDSKRYQSLQMHHRECLELFGRLLRIQNSRRIFAVVYVKGILGRKCDSKRYR